MNFPNPCLLSHINTVDIKLFQMWDTITDIFYSLLIFLKDIFYFNLP